MLFGIRLISVIFEWLDRVRKYIFRRRLTTSDVGTLKKFFPYYQRLRPLHQKEFLYRLEIIVSEKRFFARGGLQGVTDEMKILIGATIVQVVFGYKNVRLKHFKNILVYPDVYLSTISNKKHAGEVNPKHGAIVLSWKNFAIGLVDEKDGLNLGIHEVAHALKLENWIQSNDESNFFHPKLWEKYVELSAFEMRNIAENQDDFFRKRGSENQHEFFAVALENFFERPHEFQRRKSELFDVLVGLLRQNPIALQQAQK